MIIILVAVLLTVMLMQNTGTVSFKFLWATFWISKLLMLIIIGGIFFVLGILVGRPKRVKRLGGDPSENDWDKNNKNTLSDEDREYIN
jgi:uncharacterized integral membrane protein